MKVIDNGWYTDGDRSEALPVDWTPDHGPHCKAGFSPHGYQCTREEGHVGHHAAGDGYRICAVWS